MSDPQPVQTLPPPATDDRTLPTIVYVLYLVGVVNGLTAIIGFIIALASRATASPAMETHYRFQIRTFIGALLIGAVGVVLFIIGLPLLLVVIGILFLKAAAGCGALAALYFIARSVVGLVRLSNGEAYPNPEALLL